MPCRRGAVLASLLVFAASVGASAQTTAPSTSFVSPGAPVISADSPPARNPAINPSAAGLSQGSMTAPNNTGTGRPGAEQRTASRGEITEAQARRWLRYYGYAGIVNLHVDPEGHWQVQATQQWPPRQRWHSTSAAP